MKRLIGSDGALSAGLFGDQIIAGADTVAGVWYRVDGIDDTASVLPTGTTVGYMYKASEALTLVGDDLLTPFEGTKLCDIQNWSLDFSKSDIDVTTLCDSHKVYRAGKSDVTGSMDGVMTTGITDMQNGILNGFVDIVKQDNGAGTYEILEKEDIELYALLYTDDTTVEGEVESAYFSAIELTGFQASAGGEDAQTFSSPFRVSPSTTGIVFYEYTVPASV